MDLVNRILGGLVEGLLWPFRGLHPLVGLAFVSLLAALGMLWIFKRTSNQERLEAVKRQIHAGLFEIRLYNDDLRAILRAQTEILRHNAHYLLLSLVPLVWMIVPFVLVMAQLQAHYGWQGLRPGEATVLTVTLAEDAVEAGGNMHAAAAAGVGAASNPLAAGKPQVALRVPAGLRVETPPVWVPATRTLAWRVRAVEPGGWQATISWKDHTVEKRVDVGAGYARRAPHRAPSFLNAVLYPGETSLPRNGAFTALALDYEDASIELLGLRLHWLIWFFGLTLVFALLLRNRLGVVI